MQIHVFRGGLAALLLAAVAGCAQTSEQKAEDKDSRVAREAPLGSRIKRATGVAPVVSGTREDVENAKMQQGATQAGMVNNPSKYSNVR